jgi:hypothetical protein
MTTQPEPVCGCCGSKNINVRLNVGCDIDPSGEETQHLNVCKDCQAEQFWVERWHDFHDYKIHHGKWSKRENGHHQDLSFYYP